MGNKIGLWVNHSKIDPENLIPQLIQWFAKQGWETVKDWDKVKCPDVNFVLSLGGDGTVLEAAREAAPFNIPVLGVNFGRLGFLCEVERGEIFPALQRVLSQKYTVEERLMMHAFLVGAEESQKYLVLNDVVFLREPSEALVTLQIKLSGEPISSPPSDGLIIATPTGSTAYSLSAGGAVVSPEVEAILITPLAAHALSSRPMVVSHNEKIEVTLARGRCCQVTFDGKHTLLLNPGETICVKTAPLKAKLIRLEGRSFPKVLREKLRDRWHE
ncbi:MAG TPA: NAD(+)/NADH kinase [Peptococcaceae bacterium]|nr:NAD(+)/NADH kinase [Peptococcaceae bacterium]